MENSPKKQRGGEATLCQKDTVTKCDISVKLLITMLNKPYNSYSVILMECETISKFMVCLFVS